MTEAVCPFKREALCPPACLFHKINQLDQLALEKMLGSSDIPVDLARQRAQVHLDVLSEYIRAQINNRKRQRALAVGTPPERLFCLIEETTVKEESS